MKKIVGLILTVVLAFSLSGCKTEKEKLANYDINVVLNDDMTLDCAMTYTFIATRQTESVYFSLYPNAFSENAEISPVNKSDELYAYPNGKSYGKVDVFKVKFNGNDLPYEVSGINLSTLKVGFEKPIDKGLKASVYIEFKVTLPNVKHRMGYGDDSVNLSGFYPIACVYEGGKYYESVYYPNGDPFYSDCANYTVSLTMPSEYVVASSMTPVKTEWSGGETRYEYKRDNVRDIAFILSKNFNVVEKKQDGVSVKYYYFNDKTPEKTLQTAVNSINYFGKKFGAYPYLEYVVAQGDFLYGGMEYPCLSLISSNLIDASRDYVVAHETAHQWFYGVLGVNQSEIGFFDEGLTELSTALYLSEHGGYAYEEYIRQAKNSYTAIRESLVYQGKVLPPIMERNLKDFSSTAEYFMIAYNRAEIMFDDIKNHMGDKKFFEFIKNFINDNAYRNVTIEDFETALSKKSKSAVKVLKEYLNGEKMIK